jgi:hypothetical protein
VLHQPAATGAASRSQVVMATVWRERQGFQSRRHCSPLLAAPPSNSRPSASPCGHGKCCRRRLAGTSTSTRAPTAIIATGWYVHRPP